ncbi:MAG: hypothetical protein IT211_07305 [Armatimonadetes bacterium]|nr:hypothetical protein [Armatimonadota bacterium]
MREAVTAEDVLTESSTLQPGTLFAHFYPISMGNRYWLPLLLFSMGVLPLRAQVPPFPELEAKQGLVVLIADAGNGRLLGGVHTEEAFQSRYFPGSLFKIAIAVAWMQRGGATPQRQFTCVGHDSTNQTLARCWLAKGHGSVKFVSAFAASCNLYFRHIAAGISHVEMIQAAKQLGMIGPSRFPGEPISPPAIPQIDDQNLLGESFTVSPAQMLRFGLTLATRGRLATTPFQLSGARYRLLYRGLQECVRTGTAKGAWRKDFTISGKTGTVYPPGTRQRTVGWFVGFAPATHPRYAIVVLQPDATGSQAATTAGDILGRLM